jgi:hypothetical protein
MKDRMDIVHVANNFVMLDTRKFSTYKETGNGNGINDKLTVQKESIFKALLHYTTARVPPYLTLQEHTKHDITAYHKKKTR